MKTSRHFLGFSRVDRRQGCLLPDAGQRDRRKQDTAEMLRDAGIEIASFGKFFADDPKVGENPDNQLLKLTDNQRELL